MGRGSKAALGAVGCLREARRAVQNSLWGIRRGSWDCAKLITGCLEKGPKVEKGGGGDQGGLGRSKRGKTEERGIKGASCVCKLPVNMLV